MTVRLELEPALEAELASEAHSRGLALDRYVREIVVTRPGSSGKQKTRNSVASAIERILELREETDGTGLIIKDLINEGRKH
jgi:hypothetical protein